MHRTLPLVAAAVLAGCQGASKSGNGATTSDPAPGITAAPMDLEGRHDSNWSYLEEKYDADGDGVVSEDEYDRDSASFARLDGDGNGTLSAADFESRGGGRGGGRGGDMQGRMAQRMTATYFQDVDDDNTREMPLAEMEASIDIYDTDGDGSVDRSEFESLAAQRRVDTPGSDAPMIRRMMDNVDSYDVIIVATDRDDDGEIDRAELIAFFEERDDGDLVWTLRDPFGGRGGRGGPDDDDEPATGPRVGTMAPDFALQPPHGGETVMLSSFRRNLPVALIFGSYT